MSLQPTDLCQAEAKTTDDCKWPSSTQTIALWSAHSMNTLGDCQSRPCFALALRVTAAASPAGETSARVSPVPVGASKW